MTYYSIWVSYKLWSYDAPLMRYSLLWPLFTSKGHYKVKHINNNWKIIYDFVYVFHKILVIACTVSEILAQIDHYIRPELDISDLENDV